MTDAFSHVTYEQVLRSFHAHHWDILPLAMESVDARRVVYLRHDVDYSLDLAADLAQVNQRNGVRACFCIPARSHLVNLRSDESRRALDRLLAFDQNIGLHFFLSDHLRPGRCATLADVHAEIQKDFDFLSAQIASAAVPVVSWHNPSVLGESCRSWVDAAIPGFVNPYHLAAKGLFYMSDSNLRFSVEEWRGAAAGQMRRMHALIHPFQWSWDVATMEEVLAHTWVHVARQMEATFRTNHIYRCALPDGLQADAFHKAVMPLLHATGYRTDGHEDS